MLLTRSKRLTIGVVMNGEDMPYSKDGIVPDMLVNPHAFPSRMTIGQFLESLGSKISTSLGLLLMVLSNKY